MRDQLCAMEGQLVGVTGRLSGFGHRKDLFCLANCLINSWDGASSVKACIEEQPGAVRVDHMWVSLDGFNGVKRYEQFGLMGRVGWYSRADGSVDLGIVDPGPNTCMTEIMAELADAPKGTSDVQIRDYLASCKELADRHRQGDLLIWSVDLSFAEFSETVDKYLLRYSRAVEATGKAMATATKNGRCSRLRKVVRMPGQTLKQANGFS